MLYKIFQKDNLLFNLQVKYYEYKVNMENKF